MSKCQQTVRKKFSNRLPCRLEGCLWQQKFETDQKDQGVAGLKFPGRGTFYLGKRINKVEQSINKVEQSINKVEQSINKVEQSINKVEPVQELI